MYRPAVLALAATAALTTGLALGPAGSASASGTVTTNVTKGLSASPALGIKHVWVIVLENEEETATFSTGPDTYLIKTLEKQGTLLTQYYGTGHNSEDNYVAMMSGQATNPYTSADCPTYSDFNGTTAPAVLDSDGQAVGVGCVYPTNVLSLPDQLAAKHVSWHGWMQDMGATPGRETSPCGIPSTGTAGQDQTQTATATDQYAARHNPFVYFHSLIDGGACASNVKPFTGFAASLAAASATPAFNLVVPDLCDDGHDAPCKGKDIAGSSAGGLVSADHFLQHVVPQIEASPAYKQGGLIVITSDEGDSSSDSTACCGEKAGPSDPEPGIMGPGGGQIGALVIGKDVVKGATDAQPYNHFSLLRSLEDLYGVTTGGTDGKGHLGFAAASGLRPFGPDVFAAQAVKATPSTPATPTPSSSASSGSSSMSSTTGASSGSLASTGGLPLTGAALALLAAAAVLTILRRRTSRT